ncbi:hypothetical protein JXA12_03080 [Candidatus Woesearchaeota archaeon]|nr:hypothetical protein [Candidatus Woesearchaeota archaeon]
MGIFDSAIQSLYYDVGILDILLPFMLIFTVIFAVLQRTKVLGKDEDGKPMKNFNVVIALVMALAAVIPHVLWGYRSLPGAQCNRFLASGFIDVVCIINNALPSVSLVVVAVLMFLIIVGIWGKNIDIGSSSLGGIVTVFSIIAIVFIFAIAAGWRAQYWPRWLIDPQTQALIIVVLVFGLIIRFIVGPSEKKNKDKESNWLKKLSESLKDSDQK